MYKKFFYKRIIVAIALACLCLFSKAQINAAFQTSRMVVKDSFKLQNKWYKSIWSIGGDNVGINTLGTINNRSLSFITNNTPKALLDSLGGFRLNGVPQSSGIDAFSIYNVIGQKSFSVGNGFMKLGSDFLSDGNLRFVSHYSDSIIGAGTFGAPLVLSFAGNVKVDFRGDNNLNYAFIVAKKGYGSMPLISVNQQVGFAGNYIPKFIIGDTGIFSNTSASLEINNPYSGVLINRVTTLQMNNIVAPVNGLMVYNTTDTCLYYYKQNSWSKIGTSSTIPALSGEVSTAGNNVTLNNAAVISKTLTGFSAAAGTLTAADNIVGAIGKLAGNVANNTAAIAVVDTLAPLPPLQSNLIRPNYTELFIRPSLSDSINKMAYTYGNTATDATTVLAEQLSASNWTSAGWTGSYAAGWIHTTGNTTVLSNTLAAVVGNFYRVGYTVTARTAGTVNITFGSQTISTISATSFTGILASSTNGLQITPTTDFDGTIVISIKQVTTYTALETFYASTGQRVFEMRNLLDTTNLFLGLQSGTRNLGANNFGLGYSALVNNLSGNDNFAAGVFSLQNNINGNNNTAIGSNSLRFNIASDNTAIGRFCLNSNSTGASNTSIGGSSLLLNTTGGSNTAMGGSALRNNVTGGNNIAIGANAGRNYTAGVAMPTTNRSLFIGNDTRAFADNQSNQVVIGDSATGKGTNTITLGNDAITGTYLKGSVSVGGAGTPSARVMITAGTASAGTAPIKLIAGTNLTAPEAGAIEYDGTNYYVTTSAAIRLTLSAALTNSAALDFASTAAQTSSVLTMTVTGAADGDPVNLGVPNASVNANTCYTAWVSAANTVSIRFNNYSSTASDPASGTFKIRVIK